MIWDIEASGFQRFGELEGQVVEDAKERPDYFLN